MSKTVLVTGACGRVGSRTIGHLLARGHRVIAVDLPSKKAQRSAARYDSRVEVCWGNICDAGLWPALLARTDAVVHLAAILPPLVDEKPALAVAAACGGLFAIPRCEG